jgi:hypothetical protein
MQFQFQTTLYSNFGFRFKYEAIAIKFQRPPNGFLSSENFKTANLTIELPYQHNVHWQSFLKLAKKERVLYNVGLGRRLDLYKSKIDDFGYGLNFDSQNLGTLVYGIGTTISLLHFKGQDLNSNPDKNFGAEFEIRAKLGWLYESGRGAILRTNFSTFYMPNDIDKNTGKEIRFFGELINSF